MFEIMRKTESGNHIWRVLPMLMIVLSGAGCAPKPVVSPVSAPMNEKQMFIESLLRKMTLDEKVGQLNLVVGDLFNTGPTVHTTESQRFDEDIRQGRLSGIFNIHGTNYITRLQKIAAKESRLGIPLLIGADVIHGFKTVMPLSIAEAASWDLHAIEQSARIAARESAVSGIRWTFAPMVDISRDARWGRNSEGAGEDPYLGSRIAEARVRGFQGSNLADPLSIAACIKHFAAYGAPEGGRDYNTVDLSEQRLQEIYLPPYKAAVEAGAATLMTSFNELNGVPATGNGGPALCLAGLGDLRQHFIDPDAALRDVDPDIPRLVLSHNPDSAEEAAVTRKSAPRIDLMICGHTHGGQVRIPGVGTAASLLSRYGDKYAAGLVRGPACPVLISRGVGISLVPFRFLVPPEVVEITLTRAPDEARADPHTLVRAARIAT